MNRKGFAPIIFLLVVVGILVAGGIAYYGYNNWLTSTIKSISNDYAKDASGNIYIINPPAGCLDICLGGPSYTEIQGVDKSTFVVLSNSAYAKDKTHVYYYELGSINPTNADLLGSYIILLNADPATFKLLIGNDNYAGDIKNVYFQGEVIRGADPETVQVVRGGYNEHVKDKNNVYYRGNVIVGADTNTFQPLLEEPYYSKDKNNIYYLESVVQGADPETFKIVLDSNTPGRDSYYFTDKNRVYYKNTPIQNSDPETFKVIAPLDSETTYAKDKNNVYINNKIIPGIDASTFVLVGKNYLKDKNNVYWGDTILPGADAKTFQRASGDYYCAKDKNRFYENGKPAKSGSVCK